MTKIYVQFSQFASFSGWHVISAADISYGFHLESAYGVVGRKVAVCEPLYNVRIFNTAINVVFTTIIYVYI